MEHNPKEFQSVSKKDLPIFIKWMDFLKWLLVILDGFPKKARFNFSDRLTYLSLQIIEDLVEARYNKNKSATRLKVHDPVVTRPVPSARHCS